LRVVPDAVGDDDDPAEIFDDPEGDDFYADASRNSTASRSPRKPGRRAASLTGVAGAAWPVRAL
jgi:hypothetical protein